VAIFGPMYFDVVFAYVTNYLSHHQCASFFMDAHTSYLLVIRISTMIQTKILRRMVQVHQAASSSSDQGRGHNRRRINRALDNTNLAVSNNNNNNLPR
jgi:hypothetical protein